MSTWTPEREADVRAIAERMEGEAGHLLRATLNALDDERARREAAERRMHEAMADRDSRHAADEARLTLYREAADKAEAERDEARAALASLVAALGGRPPCTRDGCMEHDELPTSHGPRCPHDAVQTALSAAAPIAGRYRASVLREAERVAHRVWQKRMEASRGGRGNLAARAARDISVAICALADAAEKGEGHE